MDFIAKNWFGFVLFIAALIFVPQFIGNATAELDHLSSSVFGLDAVMRKAGL